MDPVSVLLYLLVFGVVVWLCFYVIGAAFPAPMQQVARIVVGVIALLVLLTWLFGRGPFVVPVLRH